MKFSFCSLFPVVAAVALLSDGASAALNAKIKAKGKKYFGNIVDLNTVNDPQITNILKSEFGAVTAEYSWKWRNIEPARGFYRWNESDVMANWATSNGKMIRGHTFVWHQNLPGWVERITDPNVLRQVIKDHIWSVAGRYKGKVYAWDVVNELFEEDGNFRNSIFYRLLGEEFIDIAFKATRGADPTAKLYINEYNLDYAGPKINALIALVKRLQSRGVPIDGIGTQSHLALGLPTSTYQAQLTRLANVAPNIEVAITELDIRIPNPVTPEKLQQQKREYEGVTKACLSLSKCVGISLWGVTDRNSWVPSTIPGFDAPNAWDRSFVKKPAYDGMDGALN